MLSKIALFVLGIIAGGPINPYAISKLINYKRSHTLPSIPAQTIYTITNMLQEKKLISGKRMKNGNMPDRTVYSITKKGQGVLKKNLGSCLSIPEDTLSELSLAFLLMGHLDKDEVLEALKAYRHTIKEEIAIITEMHDLETKQGVSYSGLIAVEYMLNVIKVNLKTVNELIEVINADPDWGHATIPFWRNEVFQSGGARKPKKTATILQ